MEILISRKEAIEKGLKYYFTGKECSRGRIAERRVSNKHCLCDLCKEVETKRTAGFNSNNKELLLEAARERRRKNPTKAREASRRYRQRNREKEIERKRRYRENNHDKITDYSRRYLAENRERINEKSREYGINNKGLRAARKAKRRSAKNLSTPSWFGEIDEFAIKEAYDLALERKAVTGIEWHVDHMIPLRAKKACGLHCAENIQVIPAAMNLSKHNKMVLVERLEWLQSEP